MARALGGLLVLLGIVGLGCAKPPGGIYYASGQGAVTPDGLRRVEWEPFPVSYVKPGADLQRYSQVLVEELKIAEGYSGYALPDSAYTAIKRVYREAFVKAMSGSTNFGVASAPGPDVLLISGQIVDLEVTAPPPADQAPDEDVYTVSPGRMTLRVDVRDAPSGAPLVRVEEERAVDLESGGYASDVVSVSGALQELFREWAASLRRELDQFHALSALPPAPTPN